MHHPDWQYLYRRSFRIADLKRNTRSNLFQQDTGNTRIKFVCKTIAMFKGWEHRSLFVNSLAVGGYEKKLGKGWLSKNVENVEKYVALRKRIQPRPLSASFLKRQPSTVCMMMVMLLPERPDGPLPWRNRSEGTYWQKPSCRLCTASPRLASYP